MYTHTALSGTLATQFSPAVSITVWGNLSDAFGAEKVVQFP
jgi:hypothetical protein